MMRRRTKLSEIEMRRQKKKKKKKTTKKKREQAVNVSESDDVTVN